MSVAVPRPLNASMSSNITSRPSNAASTSRSRPMHSNGNTADVKMAIPSRPPMASRPSTAFTSTVTSTNAVASGSKDTSSSAGKLFAKPSKEWVLPERAKPGRKVSADEPDNKRQSQNRLSQRAHRARRTDYITTLEDRLRQYEADEIHSNVRLQEVARALKNDNERMKNELMLVKGKLTELYGEKESWDSEKRNLEDMCASLMVEVERLRSSGSAAAGGGLKLEPSRPASSGGRTMGMVASTSVTRYSNTVSTPRENGPKRIPVACPICPDPDPDCPCQQPQAQSQAPTPPVSASIIDKPHHSDCGLCKTPAECLCRIVNEDPSPPKPLAKTKCDVCTSLTVCLCDGEDVDDIPPIPRTTTAAAVPLSLRLKSKSNANGGVDKVKKTFWRLDNVVQKGEAVCSGDPSNCDACKDDKFGKEFCGHLFEQPATAAPQHVKPCINCPGNCMSIKNLLSPVPSNEGFVVDVQPPSPVLSAEEHETMRCDEAWKKLKAHPNAKFASLALLADVVAGRTKCTGPTIELSPAPVQGGTPSPGPMGMNPSSPTTPRSSTIGVGVGIGVGAHVTVPTPHRNHSHAHNHAHQTTAAHGGVKRRMGVETSAVRDALKMLDSTPSRATSEVEPVVKSEPVDLDEVNDRAAKKLRLE